MYIMHKYTYIRTLYYVMTLNKFNYYIFSLSSSVPSYCLIHRLYSLHLSRYMLPFPSVFEIIRKNFFKKCTHGSKSAIIYLTMATTYLLQKNKTCLFGSYVTSSSVWHCIPHNITFIHTRSLTNCSSHQCIFSNSSIFTLKLFFWKKFNGRR